MELYNKRIFSSWSGGKDSVLALHRAMRQGALLQGLFTMFDEEKVYSRSHGLVKEILRKQAEAIGVPLFYKGATWNDYTNTFIEALKELQNLGIEAGIFGDIDIEDHRKWVQDTCGFTKIKPFHPLWQNSRADLLKEFMDEGFSAHIVVVKESSMDKSFLGRKLDRELVSELSSLEIDPCGEEGEYHTVVTDGPIFSKPINLSISAKTISKEGYSFPDSIELIV